MFKSEQEHTPAAKTALECMKFLHKPIEYKPDYKVEACTSNGVWLVDHHNRDNGQILAQYDFVNKMYAGQETGYGFVSVESLGSEVEQKFTLMQKNINAALLSKAD